MDGDCEAVGLNETEGIKLGSIDGGELGDRDTEGIPLGKALGLEDDDGCCDGGALAVGPSVGVTEGEALVDGAGEARGAIETCCTASPSPSLSEFWKAASNDSSFSSSSLCILVSSSMGTIVVRVSSSVANQSSTLGTRKSYVVKFFNPLELGVTSSTFSNGA